MLETEIQGGALLTTDRRSQSKAGVMRLAVLRIHSPAITPTFRLPINRRLHVKIFLRKIGAGVLKRGIDLVPLSTAITPLQGYL